MSLGLLLSIIDLLVGLNAYLTIKDASDETPLDIYCRIISESICEKYQFECSQPGRQCFK